MADTKRELKAKYLALFGRSEAHSEESPEDKDRRLTKEIQDSERCLQELMEKRAFVLGETPFRKRLKAVENFLRKQELSPLLEGYQPGNFTKGDRKRIRFMFAPKGELRIAFEDEPIFPSFREAPKNSASILYCVDGPDPSHICRLEISEDESYAVSQLVDVEWEIVCEEEKLSTLKREQGDNRIGAKFADIALPNEPQEKAPSESPDEQPLESDSEKRADLESSGSLTEGGTDYEVGEEKEAGTERSVQEPGRRPDAESPSALVATNKSEKRGAERAPNDGLWGIPSLQIFQKSGDNWQITYANNPRFFSNLKGFHQLQFLFERPGQSIPAEILEKFGNSLETPNEGILLTKMSSEQLAEQESMTERPNLEFAQDELREMTDKKSLAKYRAELKGLDAELDRLPPGNPERPLIEKEKEKIIKHIGSVTGLGDKIRTFAGSSERARKNVSRAIKAALTKIQKDFPDLATILKMAVKTGSECKYTSPGSLP